MPRLILPAALSEKLILSGNITSVFATPVNEEPSPLNAQLNVVAVTTPVANISPSTLKVIPLPT